MLNRGSIMLNVGEIESINIAKGTRERGGALFSTRLV